MEDMVMDENIVTDPRITALMHAAEEVEAAELKESGRQGYMARCLVQTTFPYRQMPGKFFERTNGLLTLSVISPNGIPSGAMPRLLTAWVTTEIVRTGSREIDLGRSHRDFAEKLGLQWGGDTGKTLKREAMRLFTSMIQLSIKQNMKDDGPSSHENFTLADKSVILWQANSEQPMLWRSTITVSEGFYKECINHPVPLDLRAVDALKGSPMGIDIYVWLVFRLGFLRKPVTIPWPSLMRQFGQNYKVVRMFKRDFVARLKEALLFYPGAKVEATDAGLLLKTSPPAIARTSRRRLLIK